MSTRITVRERTPLSRKRHLVAFLAVAALLSLALVACGGTASGAEYIPPTPRATYTPTSTPSATTFATPTITPASTVGWVIYHDARFHFQVPVPPGWQPVSLTWPRETAPSGYTYYIVQFFPPGPHGVAGPGASSMAPEIVEIYITLTGPSPSSVSTIPDWSPEPHKVALGASQVLLYDRGNPGTGGEILRVAETTYGPYPMMFGMHYLPYGPWDSEIAQKDLSLYLAMMQDYRPG